MLDTACLDDDTFCADALLSQPAMTSDKKDDKRHNRVLGQIPVGALLVHDQRTSLNS